MSVNRDSPDQKQSSQRANGDRHGDASGRGGILPSDAPDLIVDAEPEAFLSAVYTQSDGDLPTTPEATEPPVEPPPWSLSETQVPFAHELPRIGVPAPSVQFPPDTDDIEGSREPLGATVSGALNTSHPVVDKSSGKRARKRRDDGTEREYHKLVQDYHKRTRKRHYTDPVDFEGILRIIGEMGWWQASIYIVLSLQQIPHSIFNLMIIFMMIQPPHWCYVKELDHNLHKNHHHGNTAFNWSNIEDVKTISIPKVPASNGKGKDQTGQQYDQCTMYDRKYSEISHMTMEEALKKYENDTKTKPCGNWSFDTSEMHVTIVTQWNLVCHENLHRADAHLAYSLGYLLGCFVSGLSSDRFGRKPTVIGFGIFASLLGFALAYATYFPVFLALRFLSAVVNEGAGLAAYVLCMEITSTRYRALVGSALQVPWALGYTLLAGLAYLVRDWRTIQIITASMYIVLVFLICILPESPRWLIVNNRLADAETIIRKACRMNNKDLPPDLELVKHAERREWVRRKERASLLHLLKSPELLVRTIIVFTIWAVTALVYYGVSLNLADQSAPRRKRMFSGNLFHNNVIAGAIELPVLVITFFLLAAGRRRSVMACLIIAGVMMLGVVLSPEEIRWLRLVFMLMGKAAAQAAFVILYIFTSEMYPTVIRNSVVGTSSMVARLGSGVAGYVAILSDVTLPVVPMIIFGVFSFVAGTLVIFLPETLNQPLPDTLKDAVEILKQDSYAGCETSLGIGMPTFARHHSPSHRLHEHQDKNGPILGLISNRPLLRHESSAYCVAGKDTGQSSSSDAQSQRTDTTTVTRDVPPRT